MNSYGNLFYMIYNAFSLQLVNTQTLVDKQIKSGYTICKEAVKCISWKVHFSRKDRYL